MQICFNVFLILYSYSENTLIVFYRSRRVRQKYLIVCAECTKILWAFGFLTYKNWIYVKNSHVLTMKCKVFTWSRIRISPSSYGSGTLFKKKLNYIIFHCISINNYNLHACFAMLALSLGILCCDLISEMPRFLFPTLRTLRFKNKMLS